MPLNIKKMAILLRFGSTTDFTRIFLSYKDISQALNIKYSTLSMLIKKFRDNNYNFVEYKRHMPCKLNK